MATAEIIMGEAVGGAKIEKETVPNDGENHTYNYPVTSLAPVIVKYSTTIHASAFVDSGTFQSSISSSHVTISYSSLSGTLTVEVAKNGWGFDVIVAHD